MVCPDCRTEIQNKSINTESDMVQCQNCTKIFKMSEQPTVINDEGFEIDNQPKGTWINKENDKIRIGASTSSPIAYFLVPFMCLLSAGMVSGMYGVQFSEDDSEPLMNLIGIAFILITFVFWIYTFMAIWGKVEITLDNKGGRVFTGIKNLGFSKRFIWGEISSINEIKSSFHYPGSQGYHIVLDGKRRISLGMGVNGSRRNFIVGAMKQVLNKLEANENLI
jgi:hypothetical protein